MRATFKLLTRSIFRRQLIKKVAVVGGLYYGTINLHQAFMVQYQHTVVSDNVGYCAVVVLQFDEKILNSKPVLEVLKSVPQITRQAKEEEEWPSVMAGVGFQTKAWERLTSQSQPEYQARAGDLGNMPVGKGNVILHIKAQTYSQAYEAVDSVLSRLPHKSYEVVSEKYGWQYQDGRDLGGFLDGTMNPNVTPQRIKVAVNEKGGSYLIHQIWQHNLKHGLSTEEQESIIGRKKDNSAEFKQLPPGSHVARTRDDHNQRLLIVRQSMPFGTVSGEHGLLFLAYAKDVHNFNQMLDRMVGKPDGVSDQIMRLSVNTFGNYYYVPSAQELSHI